MSLISARSRSNAGHVRALISCALVVVLLVATRVGHAQTETGSVNRAEETEPMLPDARALYDRGLAAFAARDLDAAIAAFQSGYAVEARREFLFAEAQAFRLKGDCVRAVALYQQFLATHPPAIQVDATKLGIDRCAQQQTDAKRSAAISRRPLVGSAELSAPAKTTEQPQPRAPALDHAAPRPLSDRWVWTTFASAGVASIVGASFLLASNRARARAEAADMHDYDVFAENWQSAESRRHGALASFGAAAGLIVIGGVRWWWVDHKASESARDSTPSQPKIAFDGQRLVLRMSY